MHAATRFFALALLIMGLGASGCTVARPAIRVTPPTKHEAPIQTCATCASHNRTTLAPSRLNRYTPEQDIQFGANLTSAHQLSHFKPENLVIDAPLQTYLHGLLDELLVTVPDYALAFAYRIQLCRDPDAKNAYAVPGGWIFFSLEIISELPSENVLVGILAHEMGHVALRHGTAQMTFTDMVQKKTTLVGRLTTPFSPFFTPNEYRLFLLFQEMEERSGIMTPEEHRRHHELEADIFAAQLMTKSRFNPVEYYHWHRERACIWDGSKAHHETHPLYAVRADRINQEISQTVDKPLSKAPSAAFTAMRNRARLLALHGAAPDPILLPPPILIRLPPHTGKWTK